MPRKTDDTGTEEQVAEAPTEQIVTLRLKENYYWLGEFHKPGDTFDYPKSEADRILNTTTLFEPVDTK